MGFHEVSFPQDQAYDSEFAAGFNTNIIELDSGLEERVSRWSGPRHQYDLSHTVRSIANLNTIKTFYVARQGAANGFRFKDWTDYSSNADGRTAPTDSDQDIGTGDASKTQFQLVKKYTSGPTTRTRKITKPVSGSVLIAFDGTPQGSGWTVNTATGIVTFGTAPGSGVVVTAGYEFEVPVRFGEEADEALNLTYEAYEQANMSIPVIELIDEAAGPEEFFYGGAYNIAYTEDITIVVANGRVIRLNPTVATSKVILPNATLQAGGGPYFYLKNEGSIGTDLYEANTDPEAAPADLSKQLAVNDNVVCVIGLDTDGTTKKWYILTVS